MAGPRAPHEVRLAYGLYTVLFSLYSSHFCLFLTEAKVVNAQEEITTSELYVAKVNNTTIRIMLPY